MRYRKTELIEAEQFWGSGKMAVKYDMWKPLPAFGSVWRIATPEGEAMVHSGDWIATDTKGEHWPITDDVFKRTYEPVEVTKMRQRYLKLGVKNIQEIEHAYQNAVWKAD
ncbi:hypothetical protein IWT25_02312 [Secundilactobacillus pentosiphilus]|uniref:Uncharacterized protein n=1 Tax=Secundilactobacillus pentosiphilus TaxID=1714682 RepID=A0A1Z5IYU7_9LACO|nr:hypothetical protein [Secundilactobacillus pentosiphilus]GAX06964.1 hypothetical protein IWT25_02312 [Secundilactobacillus pentosiphilus]